MVSVQNIDEGLIWGSVKYFDSTPVALYNGVKQAYTVISQNTKLQRSTKQLFKRKYF